MSTKAAQGITWGGAATTSANAAVLVPDYVPYRVSQPSTSLSVSCSQPAVTYRPVKLQLRITAVADEIVAEIKGLDMLQPGWNSYQAGRPSGEARSQAVAFVRLLANKDMRVLMPAVAPTSDGGVSLHWDIDDREIDIVFGDSGQEYTIARRGDSKLLDGGFVEKIERLREAVAPYLPA